MIFNELDKKMRVYEQSLDTCILPELYMAVRIDGRNFTRLTKKVSPFNTPFDVHFRDYMVETVKHLMDCGFRIVYGYTESDEISLLFHPNDDTFGRKTRKLNSILAGEASAAFSKMLGRTAVFDCRVIPLPTEEVVRDYFLWRQEDANRNALNSHCYWLFRKGGKSPVEANALLEGQSVAWKNEFLFQHEINYNDLPSWQKRGVGVWWTEYEKTGFNPVTGQAELALRRKLREEYELPLHEEYADLVISLLHECK